MQSINDYVFILDVDGTLTDGKMIYSKEGKQYKSFGCDDWNALEILCDCCSVHIISADKKGFGITQRRIEEECGYLLDMVPGSGLERWQWMQGNYPNKKIIYMGDGILDWYPLSKAEYGITTSEALPHVQRVASYVTQRTGGQRAVAEAVMHVLDKFFQKEQFCA